MNLIEAIKSGRPFKRANDTSYYYEYITADYTACMFNRNDVLAEDWEVREEVRTLTWSQVEAAMHVYGMRDLTGTFKQMLGFKE